MPLLPIACSMALSRKDHTETLEQHDKDLDCGLQIPRHTLREEGSMNGIKMVRCVTLTNDATASLCPGTWDRGVIHQLPRNRHFFDCDSTHRIEAARCWAYVLESKRVRSIRVSSKNICRY